MPADTPRNPRRWVQVRPPDLAALIMARAMAEMFRDQPDSHLPEPLATLLRQMERWKKDPKNLSNNKEPGRQELT